MPIFSHQLLRNITMITALAGQFMLSSNPQLAIPLCGIALIAALLDGWWYLQPLGKMWWWPALWGLLGLTMWREPRGWFFMAWAAIELGTSMRAQRIITGWQRQQEREAAEERARAERMASYGYPVDQPAPVRRTTVTLPPPPLPPVPLLRYPLAIVLALGGAWLGAWATRVFVTFTGWQLDLLAIGIGYLTGKAITIGAGDRSNTGLRWVSAVLAAAGVLYGRYLVIIYAVSQRDPAAANPALVIAAMMKYPGQLLGWWLLLYMAVGAWAGWRWSRDPRLDLQRVPVAAPEPEPEPETPVELLLPLALTSEQVVPGGVRLRRVHAGDLGLPTGSVVACDPMVDPGGPAFREKAAPGIYPVYLSVAHFPDGDQRVAFACLQLREAKPTRWEAASGYGVDSGTGCFMDASVAGKLGENLMEQLAEDLGRTYVHTWSVADLVVDQVTGENVIAFSSGWGDGSYVSYFGYDEHGLCCLVTNFGVVTQAGS